MSILQVVVLGLIQGFTEFLPISSTAHLYLTSWLLGWKAEALDFDIALHIGTLLAVLLYFSRDWIQIVVQGFGGNYGHDSQLYHNRGLLWLLAIGSLPVGAAGLVFNKEAEGPWRTPYVMGTTLIVIGVFMWMAERSTHKGRDLGTVNLADSIAIGISQAFAIIPGVSRSGVTISEGLFRNLDRESAARFSFLLSTPAIAAAAGKALYDFHKNGGLHGILNMNFAIGVTASTLSGCAVIAWFLRYLRRSSLRPFVYYRIIFGIIVLALALIRRPA